MINRLPTVQTSHGPQPCYLSTVVTALRAGRTKNRNYIPERGMDNVLHPERIDVPFRLLSNGNEEPFLGGEEAVT